jgi:hypothetical protein
LCHSEVKGHSLENIIFNGSSCSVIYGNDVHNVTGQSEKQKYSVNNYIESNCKVKKALYINNLIWFTRASKNQLPHFETNILGADITWQDFLDKISFLANTGSFLPVQTFRNRNYLFQVKDVFSKRLQASKIDRKKFEAITKVKLQDQQYLNKFGQQILVIRGLGGTGKTVQLWSIAYKTYNDLGFRAIILTYNKALVADVSRLLSIYGIKDAISSKSIAIKTIHSFMNDWLVALGFLKHESTDYLDRYEEYKNEVLEFLDKKVISSHDKNSCIADNSRKLCWDLILVDESIGQKTKKNFYFKYMDLKKLSLPMA